MVAILLLDGHETLREAHERRNEAEDIRNRSAW
jgi:hypothetical protein